ncbi:hypothetical protein IDH44_10260 [Paenibacillus sp. IB182496]|uniref:Uncharacterized protein n=1 Tax=Paenibacillus sabuli TaxID=2772509 RepID=A0A927BUE3_9BACL|nr:VLRF1 family aeRF1-type release factor [Paenibacillus sabuli]MBD2845573.1 hypothetical protein [Paenibacillus sabuli]
MKLQQRLSNLKQYGPESKQRVLTIYLNTEPDPGRQSAWRLRLKNGMKRLREYAHAEGEGAQAQDLDRLQPRVEGLLEAHHGELRRGLVLAMSGSGELLLLERVHVPVADDFHWREQPMLDELERTLERYPALGIVQIGGDSVCVLHTLLGEVLEEHHYEWDVETENWREKLGTAPASRHASGATHKDSYKKRLIVNRQRWLREMATILDKHARTGKWDELVLTGEAKLIADLDKELHRGPRRIVPKNMNGLPGPQVLREVYAAI